MAHLAEGLCSAFSLADKIRNSESLQQLVFSRRWLVSLADLWATSQKVQPEQHRIDHVRDLVNVYPTLLERLSQADKGP